MRLLAAAAFALVVSAADVRPARFSRGDAPGPAPQVMGWEQSVLRVHVSERGLVDWIEALGGTEPLTAALQGAVHEWRFSPAMADGKAVASQVLVASVYRPPTLYDVPPFREEPLGLAAGPGPIPVPLAMPAPAFPPTALGDGVVIVEALASVDGDVRSAVAVWSSASGFEASAVTAAENWRFRPVTGPERPVPAYAYLVFGFRQPVTTPGR